MEEKQYCASSIQRELTKATIGFQCLVSSLKDHEQSPIHATTFHHLPQIIASGNWGCGVFRGNVKLKFLLQWIAASRAKRTLHYHTFHDFQLQSQLQDLVREIHKTGCSLSGLHQYLMQLETTPSQRLNVHEMITQLATIKDQVFV